MKSGIIILLGMLSCLVISAPAQQPFVMFAVKIDMQLSQVYNVFQLEDSTYRVFTRAGQIGSPVPYPPDGRYFDISPDAKQIPFHRQFPVNTLGEYLPGDYYYTGLRYDSAGTRYSKVGLFSPQLKLRWEFRTTNNDVHLKLWPISNGQYLSLKQSGRILRFDQNGFIDSTGSISYPGLKTAFVRSISPNDMVVGLWSGQFNDTHHDTLILIKSDLQGNITSTYKYYQKEGLIYYSRLTPLQERDGYQLRFLTNTGSTGGYKYGYKIITLDSNLQEVHIKDLDTTIVNKYKDDYYYFSFDVARLKHGFAILEQPRTPDGQVSNGFIIDVFNDNWELQYQTYITDSIIKANSKEYESFDNRPWVADVMKTAKDSGVIIAGHYRIGMFPYETLPFLIKTDTAGRVVWFDATVGEIPLDIEETNSSINPIVVYPNPNTTGLLHLRFPEEFPLSQHATLTIWNALGQQVKTVSGTLESLQQLNIEDVQPGCYAVELITESGRYKSKLLVSGG